MIHQLKFYGTGSQRTLRTYLLYTGFFAVTYSVTLWYRQELIADALELVQNPLSPCYICCS